MHPTALRLFAATLALLLAGCNLGSQFLQPDERWLVEPSMLALPHEEFVLETGAGTSVHGWIVFADTEVTSAVVLCHGSRANISLLHPYYCFLRDAGHHVVVFDYRGYGHSSGDVSVDAVFDDTDVVLDRVTAHPRIDGTRVALFGISLGTLPALRSAVRRDDVAAVVVEDVVSPRAALDAAVGPFLGWIARSLVLPGSIEAADNAARLEVPSLAMVGSWDPGVAEHLAAVERAGGAVSSWIQPHTGHAPHSLLRFDGEYQHQVLDFLERAFDEGTDNDGPAVRVAEFTAIAPDALAVTLERRADLDDRLAVELAFIASDGAITFERVWLDGANATYEFGRTAQSVAAWSYLQVDASPDGSTWRQTPGALTRSADAVEHLRVLWSEVLHDETLDAARAFAVAHASWLDRLGGTLHPLARTELIPALVDAGTRLAASSDDDDRAVGRSLLERALDAEPAVHAAHYWPGMGYRAGFDATDALDRARAALDL